MDYDRDVRIVKGDVVALVGIPGSGKTTWAETWFGPYEHLSSDFYRGVLSDDENNQDVSLDAFEILWRLGHKRIQRGLTTVFDTTGLDRDRRDYMLEMARRYPMAGRTKRTVAVLFDVDLAVAIRRNLTRPRQVDASVIQKFHSRAHNLTREVLLDQGWSRVYVLNANVTDMALRFRVWRHKSEDCPERGCDCHLHL